MLLILDTGTSNLQSVANGFRRVGGEPEIAVTPDAVARAEAIVLPGVGAFEAGIAALRAAGVVESLLNRVTADGVPLLGICLGMQLLADQSEEHGTHRGLGLIPGQVVRLMPDQHGYRVPNFGWHDATAVAGNPLFDGAAEPRPFYFAHSYHFVAAAPADMAATIDYSGRKVAAAVARANVFGLQFHPEKSQDAGLDVLARFLAHARALGRAV